MAPRNSPGGGEMNLEEIEKRVRKFDYGPEIITEFHLRRDEFEWLISRVKELDVSLQSLTPGGSEFIHDPQRCVAYVREVIKSQLESIKRFAKRNKELEAFDKIHDDLVLRLAEDRYKNWLDWKKAEASNKKLRDAIEIHRELHQEHGWWQSVDQELYKALEEGEK